MADVLSIRAFGRLVGVTDTAVEVAARYYGALRRLRIGALLVAHVNRSETADRKPFGSTFWHNLARLTWFVERAEDCGDQARATITLHNRKNNVGALQPSVGYDFTFSEDHTEVSHVGVAAVADFSTKAPTWQRIVSALRRGPSTHAALAAELGIGEGTIKKAVDRGTKLFQRVPGPDGISRIALKERRIA